MIKAINQLYMLYMYCIYDNPIDNSKTGLNSGKIFYYSSKNDYYFSPSKYIRIVIIPNDAKITKCCGMFTSDKIILGDKYYIYDVKTIKKFNLTITNEYITAVCYLGIIETLEYLKKSNNIINYNECPLDSASSNGCIKVLEWWKKSGLELKYTIIALEVASQNGHINVLEWWKNSGLELKYTTNALNWASACGQVEVLEWWKNSGLPLKYDEYALQWASSNGYVKVLEWWKNSGLELKYTEDALNYASLNGGHINVLEWWKNSGLELKYDKYALDWALRDRRIEVLEWWKNSGFELDGVLKYCVIGLIWYRRMTNYKITMLKYLIF